MSHPLDNPVRSSLTGPHARFAERRGNVLRYPLEVSPFLALPDEPGEGDWADAAALAGPGGMLPLARTEIAPPAGWKVTVIGDGVQLTGEDLAAASSDPETVRLGSEAMPRGLEVVPLGPADVPEMLDLAERTKPGPFMTRTIELGTYLGFRVDGQLVAMAGERLHPAGWAELSAVCTDPAWRGRGLATRLILALTAEITARGEIPFLHVLTTNTTAIKLYEDMGFRTRQRLTFAVARVPQARLPRGHRSPAAPNPKCRARRRNARTTRRSLNNGDYRGPFHLFRGVFRPTIMQSPLKAPEFGANETAEAHVISVPALVARRFMIAKGSQSAQTVKSSRS